MKRRGSSLLMVVLIMSAISIASVTAASVLLVAQRQSTSNDLIDTARQMARAGIEEAIYRTTYGIGGGTLTAWGEYGNITYYPPTVPNYPLVAEQRTLGGTNCTAVSTVAKAGTTQVCPYYELAIRDLIAVGDSATSETWSSDQVAFGNQAFEAQDFPSGVTETIPIFAGSSITLNASTWLQSVGGSFTYSYCTTYTGGSCSGGGSSSGALPIDPSSSVQGLRITFTYGSSPSATQNLLTMTNCVAGAGGFCILGKGYTTADIVGHAGGGQVQVHDIIEFHGFTRTIRETAQYYNGQGIRLPN